MDWFMITIKFIEADLQRYMRALAKLRQSVKLFGQDEMQRRCAIDYYQLLIQNILRRNLPRPAYSKRYRSWKYEYGWQDYPSPWRLRGDLVKSLSAFRAPDGNSWIGGVPIGAMDSGGKSWDGKGSKGPKGGSKSIAMYGSIEEARRPIFGPTAEEYAKTGWSKRGREALNNLKAAWA